MIDASAVRVSDIDGRVRFNVRVQPRASRTEVAGVYDDALRIRLTAPPVDGAANEELIRFVADVFAVSRSSVKIIGGDSARSKVVEIEGITERAFRDVVRDVATKP